MRCIDILDREHQVIHRLLLCLGGLLERLRETDGLDGGRALDILSLFEDFADGSHQEKEEGHFFPVLRRRAAEGDDDLDAYVQEHVEERLRFASLREHLEGACYADPLSLDLFSLHGHAYLELHREHMAREAALVLPLAAKRLTERDDELVLEGFRRVEGLYLPGSEALRRVEALERGHPTIRRAGA